jgi:hypothetical protein
MNTRLLFLGRCARNQRLKLLNLWATIVNLKFCRLYHTSLARLDSCLNVLSYNWRLEFYIYGIYVRLWDFNTQRLLLETASGQMTPCIMTRGATLSNLKRVSLHLVDYLSKTHLVRSSHLLVRSSWPTTCIYAVVNPGQLPQGHGSWK